MRMMFLVLVLVVLIVIIAAYLMLTGGIPGLPAASGGLGGGANVGMQPPPLPD